VSTLQPFLLILTLVLVGGCARVCARVYARHRAALPSDGTMQRLRRAATSGEGAASEKPQESPGSAGSGGRGSERPLEEKVISEVLGARNRPLAVLALNELTTEVSIALQDARTLPPAVGRVALLGGTALGLTAMATALRNEQGATAAMWGGACLLLAVAGAGVCGVYGRLARRAAERRREQTRELIRLLERRLPST
jgi:hypothetical protein